MRDFIAPFFSINEIRKSYSYEIIQKVPLKGITNSCLHWV